MKREWLYGQDPPQPTAYQKLNIRNKSLPDNFLFSKPPQFQPLLKYWGHLKISSRTPQIVVLMAKIHLQHHILWCRRRIFAIDTTICGSKANFCHRHHNLRCPSRNFSSAPNISTGAEIVGVWKTKCYLEDFYLSLTFCYLLFVTCYILRAF